MADSGELAESLTRRAKYFAEFHPPLRSEFKFRRGRFCLSFFLGPLNKNQLRTDVDLYPFSALDYLPYV